MKYDLALVMPVYNEEACIAAVVRSWRDMLSRCRINFLMVVLNDGSWDDTKEALAEFDGDARIEVVNKENTGHGPTILVGYRGAVEAADWVFQCDSDDEMKPASFPALWERRDAYDALFGSRQGRTQNLGRKLISACSRLVVRALFGNGVADVNTPYRLIRAPILKEIAAQIPTNTFAPNVIISGALSKAGLHIYNRPVACEGRKTGVASIVKWKLWKAAVRSFLQTVVCRPTITRVSCWPYPGQGTDAALLRR